MKMKNKQTGLKRHIWPMAAMACAFVIPIAAHAGPKDDKNTSKGGPLCPVSEQNGCGECDGKVTELTLRYIGSQEALIAFEQKHGEVVFESVVRPGDNITIHGVDKDGTFGTELSYYFEGAYQGGIHTSCSKPIGPGMVFFGNIAIVSGASLRGGELCPEVSQNGCVECVPNVRSLTLVYNGSRAATVTVRQKEGVIFDRVVAPGESFEIHGVDTDGTFGKEIELFVDGRPHGKIHTSCSVPIGPGLEVGVFEVVAGVSGKEPYDESDDENCGECDGKITKLSLVYNGKSAATVTVQQKKGEVIFNGAVNPNQFFSFSGVDKDGTMGTEITVYVNNAFNVAIHTSCSKPIEVGMDFGDFTVTSGESLRGGALCGSYDSGNNPGGGSDDPPITDGDECPDNPNRTKEGPCGCDDRKNNKDRDGDGTPDCIDLCDRDPNKVEPGIGGCGVAEIDEDGDCVPSGMDINDNITAVFDHTPECSYKPEGAPCNDGICQGTHTCTADGECGDASECSPAAGSSTCSEPCTYRRFKDRFYWFCPCAKSWDEADALCGQVPSRSLVEVGSDAENLFIACNIKSLLGEKAWIGGNDLDAEGKWHWANYKDLSHHAFWDGDEDGEKLYRYVSWMDGEPSGGDLENCASMAGDAAGLWSDGDCRARMPFICEETAKRLDVPTLDWMPDPHELLNQPDAEDADTCVEEEDINFTLDDIPNWRTDDYGAPMANECAEAQERGDCVLQDNGEWSEGCETYCKGIAEPPVIGEQGVQQGEACAEDEEYFCRVTVDEYRQEHGGLIKYCTPNTDCGAGYMCGWASKCSQRWDDAKKEWTACTDADCYDCENISAIKDGEIVIDNEDKDYCGSTFGRKDLPVQHDKNGNPIYNEMNADGVSISSECQMIHPGLCTGCTPKDPNHPEECACRSTGECMLRGYGLKSVCLGSPFTLPAIADNDDKKLTIPKEFYTDGGPRIGVCGKIDDSCPLWEDPNHDPNNRVCATYDLCEKLDPDTDAGELDDIQSKLDESTLDPDKVFGEPSEPKDKPYSPKKWIDPSNGPLGAEHPWCEYDAVEGDLKDQNTNGADKKNGAASRPGEDNKDKVEFVFTPNLTLDYKMGKGPLGLIEPSVTAEAGVSAGVELDKLLETISTTIDIVDVLASIKLGLDAGPEDPAEGICGLSTNDSKLIIFGVDFLPEKLRMSFPEEDDRIECVTQYKKVKELVNKAKKAYMDAQTLLQFFKDGDVAKLLSDLPGGYLAGELDTFGTLLPEGQREAVGNLLKLIASLEGQIRGLKQAIQNRDVNAALKELSIDDLSDELKQLLPAEIAGAIDGIKGAMGGVGSAQEKLDNAQKGLLFAQQGADHMDVALKKARKRLQDAEAALTNNTDATLEEQLQAEVDKARQDFEKAQTNLAGVQDFVKQLQGQVRTALQNLQGALNILGDKLDIGRAAYGVLVDATLASLKGFERLPDGFLSQKLAEENVPADFPALNDIYNGDLKLEPAEETINRFVDYYNNVVMTQLTDAVDDLVEKIPPITLNEEGELYQKLNQEWSKNEEITLFTQTFMIGPIPCNLEVLFTMTYGVDIAFVPELRLGEAVKNLINIMPAQYQDPSDPFANVSFHAKPFAGAGIALFVGVGFDIGVAAAKAGIEGSVNLAKLGMDLWAGAGVSLNANEDTRPAPDYLGEYSEVDSSGEVEFSVFPRKLKFALHYDYGMALRIEDMLAAKLAVKLKLKFLFFSKTYRKTLASWAGMCPAPGKEGTRDSWCDVPLFSGSGSTDLDLSICDDDHDWGTLQMPMPFTVLKKLPSALSNKSANNDMTSWERPFVELDRKPGDISIDDAYVPILPSNEDDSDESADAAAFNLLMSQMEKPFYDTLCVEKDPGPNVY